MNAPWTRHDDEAFRGLVEAHVPAEEIAAKLHRSIETLRQRGYVLGLPRKWFRTKACYSSRALVTSQTTPTNSDTMIATGALKVKD